MEKKKQTTKQQKHTFYITYKWKKEQQNPGFFSEGELNRTRFLSTLSEPLHFKKLKACTFPKYFKNIFTQILNFSSFIISIQ